MSSLEKIRPNPPIELTVDSSYLQILPDGGKITKLNLLGIPVFWSGIRPDGNNAATHVSAPWMGPFKAELPEGVENPGSHGPARNAIWKPYDRTGFNAQLIMKVENLEELYPKLHLFQSVMLGENYFAQLLSIDNRSFKIQPNVNPGLHWYLEKGPAELDEIEINGATYEAANWEEPSIIEAKLSNSIVIPGHAKFNLKTNFPNLILWAQRNQDGSHSFAGIEPSHNPSLISQAPILEGGQIRHYFGVIDSFTPLTA